MFDGFVASGERASAGIKRAIVHASAILTGRFVLFRVVKAVESDGDRDD